LAAASTPVDVVWLRYLADFVNPLAQVNVTGHTANPIRVGIQQNFLLRENLRAEYLFIV
jgi:hypothetical protein